MNVFQRLRLLFTSIILIVLSGTVFSVTSADVLGHVENHQIGLVINHAVSPDGKYVFSTTISPTKIYAHSRDPNTGRLLAELQSIEATDFIAGKSPSFYPQGLVVSPDSKQVYISASFGVPGDTLFNFEKSVLRFDISDTGTLSYNSRVVTGAERGLAISKNGKYLYAGSTGSRARIAAVSRASNGNITAVETLTKDLNDNEFVNTEKISISSDGKNLYASSVSSDGHLYVFDINQNNGKLISKKSFINKNITNSNKKAGDISVTGSGGSGTAITDDGKFFYSVAGYGDDPKDSISIFKRASDGVLTFFKNIQAPFDSKIPTLRILFSAKAELIISPNQKFVYTYDGIMETIGVWKRDINTGDLSFVGVVESNAPVDLDKGAEEKMVTSEDGRHLYVNAGGGIVVFDLRADMSVVKSDGTDPVEPSTTIDYTLAVTNNAPSDAQNVVVVDTLPAGTSFVSGTVNSPTGSCSANGQVVTCTMGQMLANDGYNAVIKVTAPATAGTITNTVTVSADQLDTNTTNDTDTETTTISGGGTTPTNPTTPSTGSGGGSLPLELIVLLLLPALLRRRKYS